MGEGIEGLVENTHPNPPTPRKGGYTIVSGAWPGSS